MIIVDIEKIQKVKMNHEDTSLVDIQVIFQPHYYIYQFEQAIRA